MSRHLHGDGADGLIARDNIRRHMRRTGRTIRGHKLWSEDEVNVVRHHYPDWRSIHQMLPLRSQKAIIGKAVRLGLTRRYRLWSPGELAILRRVYPASPWSEIFRCLPGRNRSQIRTAARARRIRRVKPAYRPTDYPILNRILERCAETKITLRDLDAFVDGSGYFGLGRFRRHAFNTRAIRRAYAVLDGRADAIFDH